MTDSVGLDFDSEPLKRGVDKSISSLDALAEALKRLEAITSKSSSRTESEITQTLNTIRSFSKGLDDVYRDMAASANEGTKEYPKLVREMNIAIQRSFEARLAKEIALGNEELAYWKSQGASLNGLQKAQLREWEAIQKAKVTSATPMGLEETRAMLGLPSTASMKLLASQLKTQMEEAVAQSTAKARAATPMGLEETRAMLGLPSTASMKLLASQLKTQMEEAVAIQNMQMRGSKLGIPSTSIMGEFTPYDAAKARMKALDEQSKALGSSFKKLTVDGNDLHSMARGLASGFGLLWLTWGNLIPLLAGSAISFGFTRALKSGAEFQQSLFVIAELAGNTTEVTNNLGQALLDLGRTSQYGPIEAAKALEQLTLAGVSAKDAMTALQPTLRFASAGGVPTKDAAETLVAVATAYGFVASDYEAVGDLIAKTASTTMSSVKDLAEAFKVSTTVSQQYGVTLQETADGLGRLAQVNIRGTSAGTAWKNMVAEMAKQTGKQADAMEGLGVSALGADGKLRGVMAVMEDMSKVLINKTGPAQAKYIETLQNERGAKGFGTFQASFLNMVRTGEQFKSQLAEIDKAMAEGRNEEAKAMRINLVTQAYEQMRLASEKARKEASGFNFLADLENKLQPNQLFAGLKASLETNLITAFKNSEDAVSLLGFRIREALNSDDFQRSVTAIVSAVTSLVTVLVNTISWLDKHKQAVLTAVTALVTYRIAASAASAVILAWPKIVDAARASMLAYAISTDAATFATNTFLSLGWGRIIGLGFALAGAAIAWSKFGDSAQEAAEKVNNASIEASKDKIENLEKQREFVNKGIEEELAKTKSLIEAKKKGLSDTKADEKAYEDAQLARIDRIAQEQISIVELTAKNRKLAVSYDTVRESMMGEYAQGPEARFAEIDKQTSAEIEAVLAVAAARKTATKSMLSDLLAAKQELANLGYAGAAARTKPITGTDTSTPGIGEKEGTRQIANIQAMIVAQKKLTEELKYAQFTEDEFTKVEKTRDKSLAELNEKYKEATKESNNLSGAAKAELQVKKLITEALIQSNFELAMENAARKAESADRIARIESYLKEEDAIKSLSDARKASLVSLKLDNEVSRKAFEFSQANKYNLPAVAAAKKAAYDIDVQYADKRLKLLNDQIEAEVKLDEAGLGNSNQMTELQKSYAESKRKLDIEQAAATGTATAQVYQEAWDNATGKIATNFLSSMMDNTMSLKDFMIKSFADTILMPQLQLMTTQGISALLGGSSGMFASLMGIKMPSFEGGGSTGGGPRSGGLDGKGGFLAMLHPKESVTDHTISNSKESSSAAPIYITINNTVGDVATKSMLDAANARTVRQIQSGISRSRTYNGSMSNV